MILTLNDPLGAVRAITHQCQTSGITGTKKASADNTGLSVFAKTLPQVFTLFILCFKPIHRSTEHG